MARHLTKPAAKQRKNFFLRAVLAVQNSTKNHTEKEEMFSILKNISTKLDEGAHPRFASQILLIH